MTTNEAEQAARAPEKESGEKLPEISAAPQTVETEKTPETEKEGEAKMAAKTEAGAGKKLRLPLLRKTARPLPSARDEVTVRIEKIMEEGLSDAFLRLSPVARQEFKLKGEETAVKIRELLRSTHVKVKKIFKLLFEWLKMLPGVNRFFLEQEAKIKADKILTLKDRF